MKKLLLICIVIVGIVFVAGCIGGEKTSSETSPDSQTNPKSDTQNPDLILTLSDFPSGYKLEYSAKHAVLKSSECNVINGCLNETLTTNNKLIIRYNDALPIGTRFVGSSVKFTHNSGRELHLNYLIFDSNNGLKELLDKQRNDEAGKILKLAGAFKVQKGQANIGDESFYNILTVPTYDIEYIELVFIDGKKYVSIVSTDEKGKGLEEALRIAKIVESRLN